MFNPHKTRQDSIANIKPPLVSGSPGRGTDPSSGDVWGFGAVASDIRRLAWDRGFRICYKSLGFRIQGFLIRD